MITEGTYTFYAAETPQSELDLIKNTLNVEKEEDFSTLDLDDAVKKTLSLKTNEQIHLLHGILDKFYFLSNDIIIEKKVENFLSRKEFKSLRDVLSAIVETYETEEEKIEKLKATELELGIKIVDSDE
jgi:hypothetical protein